MIGGDGGVKIDTELGVEEHARRKRLSVGYSVALSDDPVRP